MLCIYILNEKNSLDKSIKLLLYLIAANVVAHNDIWLVGDLMLTETLASLQQICDIRVRLNKKQLYIYEFFNVKTFYPSLLPVTRNPFA